MRILICSVTNKSEEYLEAHFESLFSQVVPDFVKREYFYLVDPDSEESGAYLEKIGVDWEFAEAKPEGAEYGVSEETHHWTKPTFYWLGEQKQKLLEKGKDYDAVFMVDTDLVLGPDTLASLISTQKPIVSAVFWTKWSPNMPALPQVWMEHPYEMQGRGREAHEFLGDLASRQVVKVAGLGACTLFRADTLDKISYLHLPGLPESGMWQGEDRALCVRAQNNHIDLWGDGWPSVFHIYRPSDLKDVPKYQDLLERTCGNVPEFGDLVSLRLTPVEEVNLAGWSYLYRGRIGDSNLLPSIASALASRTVGDDFFVQCKFPVWWKVPEYRGITKTIRVEFLGLKKPHIHPSRTDEDDYGIYYET